MSGEGRNLELFPNLGRRPRRVRRGPDDGSWRTPVATSPSLAAPRPKLEEPFFRQPRREFEWAGGVHVTDSVLWCDANRRRELSFISSANVDLAGKNRRILATEQTVKILSRGSGRVDALTSPYRRGFVLGPLELEMHPAGRMLGAAMLLIRRGGRRLLYAGDFLTQQPATAERARPVPCDAVALPPTFGRQLYRFPPREEVLEKILSFVDDSLDAKRTPVLLVPPLGPAEELMYLLGRRGYRLRVHRSIHDVAKVYIKLGCNLIGAKRLQGQVAKDEVVLVPPILRHDATVRKLEGRRVALVSGRAMEPGYPFKLRVDEAFPLAEAADHEELLAFVRECGASEVYLTSACEELGDALRSRGVRVHDLIRPEQLALF